MRRIKGPRFTIAALPLLTVVFIADIPAKIIIPPKDDSRILSDQVREILLPDCGSCHTSSLPTSRPGAVKVFDFAMENWSSTMTHQQLDGLARRTISKYDSVKSKTISDFILIAKQMTR